MKRSDFVNKLNQTSIMNDMDNCEKLLCILENLGMQPPPVEVHNGVERFYKFGSFCTIRCNCRYCNPSYLVNEWEPE